MLDKQSPIPLYHQIKTLLEERIDSGEWPPGLRVPSERELCEQFGVSRITVRQAISQLVYEARLVRQQGLGTFVASPRIHQHLSLLTGFTEDMQRHGRRPSSRVLRFEQASASASVGRELGLETGEPVILLMRLRLIDGDPLAVETAFLPAHRCPGLLGEDLENQSLYSLLGRKFAIFPERALQRLEAVACPEAEARLLGVRKASPILHIYRTTFNGQDQPFEYTESYYRGDRYIFQAELSNQLRWIGSLRA